MTIDQYVGEQVHIIQWRNKIASDKLRKQMGISPATLNRKLHGKVTWSVEDLMNAANALGVSAADLLPPTSSAGAAIRAMPGGEELIENAQRGTGPASATDAGAFVTGEYETSAIRTKCPHTPGFDAKRPQAPAPITRWTLPRTTGGTQSCTSSTPLTTMRPTSTRRAGHHKPSRCDSRTFGNSRMHSPTSP